MHEIIISLGVLRTENHHDFGDVLENIKLYCKGNFKLKTG